MDDVEQAGGHPDGDAPLDTLPQLLLLLDRNARIVWANRVGERWGLRAACVGGTAHALLHPECDAAECGLAAYLQHGGDAWRGGLWQGEAPPLGGMGIRRVGGVSGGGEGMLLLSVERHVPGPCVESQPDEGAGQAEDPLDLAALRESPALHAALVHNTLTGIYILGLGRIIFCNERFAEIFGFEREALFGMPIGQLLGEQVAGHTPATGHAMGSAGVYAGVAGNGERVWLKCSYSMLETKAGRYIVGNVIEITEQIRTQEEMRQSEVELELLSEQLMTLQEAERKRISAELHDSIGQRLSTIKFSVDDALRRLETEAPEVCQRRLQGVAERVRGTIEEVRRISMDLRPSMLDDLGLIATIEWISREFGQLAPRTAVEKQVAVSEGEIPDELKLVIFRLLQEALHNVAKHADASRVTVALERDGERLVLRVSDDGRGFLPEHAQRERQGLGLRSMQERVKFSGGALALHSEPGNGTRLRAEWPLPAESPMR